MEIGIDVKAITRKSTKVTTESTATNAGDKFNGLRKGTDIYMPPSTAMLTIGTYCHEVGHIMGDTLSFQAGLKPGEQPDVLSVDEVKDLNTIILLSLDETLYLMQNISSKDTKPADNVVLGIANKLLKTYTIGKFDPNSVSFHSVSQAELETLVKKCELNTSVVDSSGDIVTVNSKEGRNSEVPAFAAEFCCYQILENTLKNYGIIDSRGFITVGPVDSPPHQRARNIIGQAFRHKGWRPPSMKDIRAKETPKK